MKKLLLLVLLVIGLPIVTADWTLEATLSEASWGVTGVAFSYDNNYVAYSVTIEDNAVFVHDTNNWSLITSLTEASASVDCVAFSPDNQYIAYGGHDDNVYVHLLSDWSLVVNLTEANNNVPSVTFSPDSSMIAYSSADEGVYVHNTSDWSLIVRLNESTDNPNSVDFSPDGSLIAYGANDHKVYVHNVSDWSLITTLTDSSSLVKSVAFSSDGRWLAYADYSGHAVINDVTDWSLETKLSSATSYLFSVAFSPDNKWFSYGSHDTNAYIHSQGDWIPETTLTDGGGTISQIDFSQNNQWVAIASGDNNTYIYNRGDVCTATPPYDEVYVDDDYNTSTPCLGYDHFNKIQDGINAVEEGGTVNVYNGIYYENVVVNKTINLVGEDRDGTIIDGNYSGNVVNITTDWINMSEFKVTNSKNNWSYAGIDIFSNYNTISGNIISDNYFGILLFSSSNTIFGNNILNNNDGIRVYDGSYNIISENIIGSNNEIGIYFDSSINNNTISENNITSNNIGIYLNYFGNNHSILGNTIILNNAYGIYLSTQTNYNIISGNNISKNDEGIRFYLNSNNTISGNNITNNDIGINLIYSSNNILENNILNNNKGIQLSFCSNNSKIYHNNLLNNAQNAYVECNDESNNTWDDGYPSGGNYWSDFDEPSEGAYDTNGDGIVDSPYNISGGSNKDRYPLINPWNGTLPTPPNECGPNPFPGCQVTQSTVFNNSGSPFDLTGGPVGIYINASNVVLDCNNSILSCRTQTGDGCIYIGSIKNNVTIKNCIINQSDQGIYGGEINNNITIINNNITSEHHNLYFENNDQNYINISNNYFYHIGGENGTFGRAIEFSPDWNGSYIYIRDNWLDTGALAIGIANTQHVQNNYIFIENNNITDASYIFYEEGEWQTENGTCISIVAAEHISIKDNWCAGSIILGNSGLFHLSIDNNYLYDGSMGIDGFQYDINVTNNEFRTIDEDGYIEPAYISFVWDHCWNFPGGPGGAEFHDINVFNNTNFIFIVGGQPQEDCIIRYDNFKYYNNTVNASYGSVFMAGNYSNFDVRWNTFIGTDDITNLYGVPGGSIFMVSGVSLLGDAIFNSVKIRNNSFDGGIWLDGGGGYSVDIIDLDINNNIIDINNKPKFHGISINNINVQSNALLIENNHIYNVNNTDSKGTGSSVWIDSTDNVIFRNNLINNSKRYGIFFDNGNNNQILNNRFYNIDATTILIDDSFNIIVEYNKIENCYDGLVFWNTSNSNASHNTFTNIVTGVTSGTPTPPNPENIVFYNNTIINASSSSIHTTKANNVAIKNNYVYNTASDGVNIMESDVTIQNNYIENTTWWGIKIQDSVSNTTIQNNTLIRTLGIDCLRSKCTVNSNKIKYDSYAGNGGLGIYCEESENMYAAYNDIQYQCTGLLGKLCNHSTFEYNYLANMTVETLGVCGGDEGGFSFYDGNNYNTFRYNTLIYNDSIIFEFNNKSGNPSNHNLVTENDCTVYDCSVFPEHYTNDTGINNTIVNNICYDGRNVTLPDLTITSKDISFSDSNPSEDQTITIFAKVYNIGEEEAEDVVVRFFDSDTLIGEKNISLIEVNSYVETSVEWIASQEGYHHIKVIVDPENKIFESDENNNIATRPLLVGEADYGGINVTGLLSKDEVFTGSWVTVSGDAIYNTTFGAGEPVAGADVTITIASDEYNTYTTSTGDYSKNILAPSTPGNYTVQVTVTDFTFYKTIEMQIKVNQSPQVDLVPYQLTFSEDKPSNKTTINISALVYNVGIEDATDVLVKFYDGATVIGNQTISSLQAGDYETVIIQWEAKPVGWHYIQVKVDPEDAIDESNNNNNQNYKYIYVYEEKADLSPVSISFSDYTPAINQTITIFSKIKNLGATNATNVLVKFFSDSNEIGQKTISVVPGKGETSTSIYWNASPEGWRTIKVSADPYNNINESTDTNNNYTTNIYVNPTDLGVYYYYISFSNNNPLLGDIVTIYAKIRNYGATDVSDVNVSFSDNDVEIEKKTISFISAGSYKILNVSWNTTYVGWHTIKVHIDPEGNLEEEPNIHSNIAYKNIYVDYPLDLYTYSEDIEFSNNNPDPNDNITINTTIYNTGKEAAENVTIIFYDVDVEEIDTQIIDSIGVDESVTLSANWTVGYLGSHVIKVAIDPNHEIDESKNNNNATRAILVGPVPDLTLSSDDIAFSNSEPTEGDIITINATIHNDWRGNASNVTVRFFDGSPETGTHIGEDQIIEFLEAWDNSTVSVPWNTTDKAGSHDIYVIVDPDDYIVEINETNNQEYKNIIIKTLDIGIPWIGNETQNESLITSASDVTFTVDVIDTDIDTVIFSMNASNRTWKNFTVENRALVYSNDYDTDWSSWNYSGRYSVPYYSNGRYILFWRWTVVNNAEFLHNCSFFDQWMFNENYIFRANITFIDTLIGLGNPPQSYPSYIDGGIAFSNGPYEFVYARSPINLYYSGKANDIGETALSRWVATTPNQTYLEDIPGNSSSGFGNFTVNETYWMEIRFKPNNKIEYEISNSSSIVFNVTLDYDYSSLPINNYCFGAFSQTYQGPVKFSFDNLRVYKETANHYIVKIPNSYFTVDPDAPDVAWYFWVNDSEGHTNQTKIHSFTVLPYCGNGICEYGEGPSNCSLDCGLSGPVLELKMDENNGTIAYDSSGNNNDGNISGAEWTTGYVNSALDFDGNDQIVVADDETLRITGDLTIEAYIKTESSQGHILDKYVPSSPWPGYGSRIYNGKLLFWSSGHGSWVEGNKRIDDGYWHHIAITLNGLNLTFYVDGEVDKSVTITGTPTSSTYDLIIGSSPAGGMRLDGILDEIKLYDRAKSSTELYNEVYPEENVTKLNLKLDETSGTIAYDSSVYNNDGYLKNGPEWVSGYINNALYFDGNDDYVVVPDKVPLRITANLTIEAYIKTEDSEGHILDKYVPSSPWSGYSSRVYDGKLNFWSSGHGSWVEGTKRIDDGNWHHIAITLDGLNLTFYIDGEIDKSVMLSGTPDSSTADLILGSSPAGGMRLNGTLDEVKLLSIVKSPTEIANDVYCKDADNDGFYLITGVCGGFVDCNDNDDKVRPPINNETVTEDVQFCNGMYYLPDGLWFDGIHAYFGEAGLVQFS